MIRPAHLLPVVLGAGAVLSSCGSAAPSPLERQRMEEQAAAAARDAQDAPTVTLLADGIAFGETKVPFSTQQDVAIETLQQAIGLPSNLSRPADCGAGELFVASYDSGLVLNFRQDAFAGWFYRGEADEAALAGGVGTGTPVADLGPAYRPIESTLDGEFSYGDAIGGFADQGRIGALYAGINCFAR